ncbi:hypothetical protein [Bdellovibrio bacteriovorus]|uniref:Outer membrane protein beta-barrel domain-containing protein n=1 Tax=Bdellovibrio bacteriovorus str. Tiberius TaxID=1069642 RepID=K7YWK1_BDEBC|nr:hypothetical protein [Bdellovibrio bacteriovorus]AFY02063.1 hypothetical protein Bdt_2380 [Bdellovibrio bacteriovorus str. Tiberius]
MKESLSVFLLSMLLSVSALATDFETDNWSDGLHLLAGGGFNSALYTSDDDHSDGGVGVNLKTDLLYVFHPEWAVEWSASVKFNRMEDSFLLWDTLLTMGIRTQLPKIYPEMEGTPYARLFVGRAPTVLFLNGETPKGVSDPSTSRIHFDGPVVGLGWGILKKNSKGQVWFTEIAATAQTLESEEDVMMDGEVPLVLSRNQVTNNARIYSIAVTFGILAF